MARRCQTGARQLAERRRIVVTPRRGCRTGRRRSIVLLIMCSQ
jgi:hypothetical protein